MSAQTGQSQQQRQHQQMSPLASLFQDVMFDVVAFLPPRDLAVLKMVCQFFAQNYSKWDMSISELSAKRRLPNYMCRAPHQTYCEALCYEKTFEGEARKGYYHFPVFPVSTIALSFSCDRQHFASSHGDHSVKIIDFASGVIKQQLVGHPRTPWSVKFHPTKPNIVASGCLGSHVFLWDTNTGNRLTGVRVDSHVLSLAFHPEGNIIAIACTDFLHLWDYTKPLDSTNPTETLSVCSNLRPAQAVRCVIFHPNGRQVIIGEVPPAMHRTETVKLQLWEYHKSKPLSERICSPKTLCQTAQLYSDGGIDVSSCGNFLVTLSKRPGTVNQSTQLSVVAMSLEPKHLGKVQIQLTLDPRAAKHVTSVKISPSKQFILLGASSVGDDKFTSHNPVVKIFKVNWQNRSIRVVYEDWYVLIPFLRGPR
eukprot:INCI5577.2.p1 GENE.INCI5577.2~~INCI5577.2.p1  ORF type:complete len:422 (+),score=45.46 INCI5577.2:377-1642(+)